MKKVLIFLLSLVLSAYARVKHHKTHVSDATVGEGDLPTQPQVDLLFAEMHKIYKHIDCRRYAVPNLVLSCAASQSAQHLISDRKLLVYIFDALDMLPAYTTRYGLNLDFGHRVTASVSKQHNPHDQWSYSLGFDPRSLYSSMHILDIGYAVEQPILIFLAKELGFPVPVIPDYLYSVTTKMGGDEHKYAYAASKSLSILSPNQAENCASLMGSWTHRRTVEKHSGLAIIMSADHWCHTSATKMFEVVVAELELIEHAGEQIIVPKWAISKSGKSIGNVDAAYASVFP